MNSSNAIFTDKEPFKMFRSLSNGIKMPAVIMGTYPLKNEAMDLAVDAALGIGYRGFDTAHCYLNEDSLGDSLQRFLPKYGLKRNDVFITTKIGEHSAHQAEKHHVKFALWNPKSSVEESLKKLHTDYVDLLLIHWPNPDYFVESWQFLEKIYQDGIVRAIGVSNCREWHLKKLIDCGSSIIPMVNQIELHPCNAQRGIVDICRQMGIQVEAYSPLMCINHAKTLPAVLENIARFHDKSVSQIVLRWNYQHDIIPIPKSATPERIKENFEIFDFELNHDEMTSIDLLNIDKVYLSLEEYFPGVEQFKIAY